MWPIVVIAVNTFREHLRDRILYTLLLFAVLLTGASTLLADLTILEQHKIITDMGLAAIDLVGVIMAILIGIGLVSREIERRTLYTVLARPISRAQFVLGKYLGIVMTLLVNVTIMLATYLATLWLVGAPLRWALFQAVQLMVMKLLVIAAIALCCSTLSSATVSAIVTIGLVVLGHLATDLRGLAQKSRSETVKAVVTFVSYLCPNLDLLDLKGPAARGIPAPLSYDLLASAYGLMYTAMLVVGACLLFNRRDF
jgi:ABC-type transport system involved in multi-copper enzyme maturation permease subunit